MDKHVGKRYGQVCGGEMLKWVRDDWMGVRWTSMWAKGMDKYVGERCLDG